MATVLRRHDLTIVDNGQPADLYVEGEVSVAPVKPNQQHVSDLLDRALQLQKQRISLVEAEQKDLARFMTPVQRARYIALQQQFRRRAQELAGQNAAQRGGMGFQRGRLGLKKRP